MASPRALSTRRLSTARRSRARTRLEGSVTVDGAGCSPNLLKGCGTQAGPPGPDPEVSSRWRLRCTRGFSPALAAVSAENWAVSRGLATHVAPQLHPDGRAPGTGLSSPSISNASGLTAQLSHGEIGPHPGCQPTRKHNALAGLSGGAKGQLH